MAGTGFCPVRGLCIDPGFATGVQVGAHGRTDAGKTLFGDTFGTKVDRNVHFYVGRGIFIVQK